MFTSWSQNEERKQKNIQRKEKMPYSGRQFNFFFLSKRSRADLIAVKITLLGSKYFQLRGSAPQQRKS